MAIKKAAKVNNLKKSMWGVQSRETGFFLELFNTRTAARTCNSLQFPTIGKVSQNKLVKVDVTIKVVK